jgi:four helix bundle protein
MIIRSYRDLRVWQIGMDLVEDVYRLTAVFPSIETYALANQLQRAAVSVPSNIAEGHARDSTKEFLHHLSIAMGSLAELETQQLLPERLSYSEQSKVRAILSKTEEVGRMLRGLQMNLKERL